MRAWLLVAAVAGTAWGQGVERFELTLQPVQAQINGKFTQHLGTFGVASWFPREHLALQLIGGGNWYNEESAFNEELVDKYRVEAQAASSLLWTWGLFGALELEPFNGEFTLFHGPLARLGFVVSVGAGAGGTRHLLMPGRETTPAIYGDTGVRFMATVSTGLRLRLGDRFTARLELRDVGYSSAITSINGCELPELEAIDRQIIRMGRSSYNGECQGFDLRAVPAGTRLASMRSTDITHNLSVALGVGLSF